MQGEQFGNVVTVKYSNSPSLCSFSFIFMTNFNFEFQTRLCRGIQTSLSLETRLYIDTVHLVLLDSLILFISQFVIFAYFITRPLMYLPLPFNPLRFLLPTCSLPVLFNCLFNVVLIFCYFVTHN